MRKVFILFLGIIFSSIIFAQTITVLTNAVTVHDGKTIYTIAEDLLHKDFPNVKVQYQIIDVTAGSTMTMDAQLAAGTPPNVYLDSSVRAGKYMDVNYALDLSKYIRDLSKYNKGALDQYYRSGKLLGLPQYGGAQGICVNLDIMKDIGFTVKWDWTIDDFMKMAQLVKDKYQGKKFATMLFAKDQSGDYLLHNWFEAFGAHYYVNNDHDNAVIAKTGGAKVYAFYQTLIKNGYVPANAATLNDDDYCLQWLSGNLAATTFFPNWTAGYLKTGIDQGIIKQAFNFMFVPFPRGPGVAKVPTYINNGVYVVYNSKDDNLNKIAARFVEYANGLAAQDLVVRMESCISNRSDVPASTDPRVAEIANIVSQNGIYDAGLTDPRFTERRSFQFPILQKLFNFQISPDDAIKEYEAKLSSVK
jgi:ABC-type glycerol-3-phosphate transport system substrate-binding protein